MPASTRRSARPKKSQFRIGRVHGYLRGRVWYLRYREQGRRRQPRAGTDYQLARDMAAEINAQLEVGAISMLGFEPIGMLTLQEQWLAHHEHVRRSSVQTINRYRTATQHLINFVSTVRPIRRASDFRVQHAEQFVRHLRELQVAPNGHPHSAKRGLKDQGIKFVLETCCTMFNYAQRHRHLSPYAENPFRTLEIGRIPIEDAPEIVPFDDATSVALLQAADSWQLPVFAMLLFTGMRPGELAHLLLPDDLDLGNGWIRIRNKIEMGWQIKTRCARDIPLIPELTAALRYLLKGRTIGPVVRQRRFDQGFIPALGHLTPSQLADVIRSRATATKECSQATRRNQLAIAKSVWREMGAIREDWIRKEFMRLMRSIGQPNITTPKILRHTFATILQDANVDPLVRNELMGHSPASRNGTSLGMTGVYTHTRPETKRHQLEAAFAGRPALMVLQERVGEFRRG